MREGDMRGQRDKEGGGRRRTRIRPLRGRQQAPAGGNRVKCSGNNEVFRCPARPSGSLSSLSYPPLSRFRRYDCRRLHRREARPPYIFRIWNKCTVGRKRGARRCSASFFNYVQPPLGRAALEEVYPPFAFRPPSAFLVELSRLSSPPSTLFLVFRATR